MNTPQHKKQRKQQTRRQQIQLWDKTYFQTTAIENDVKHTKQQKLPTKSVWKSTTDIAIGNITLQKIQFQVNNKSFVTPTQNNSYQPSIRNTSPQSTQRYKC